ncbi:LTA synthase family protein [Cellulosilyticum ruminicola]|uniref:LTA synthase family protein n=1 Tax=Cellulosilyticum ruminicola TaxID=425254 RepID=UPI0006CF6FFA|nr:LTA synthase family protein [Cellulosilyticum ruminicola]
MESRYRNDQERIELWMSLSLLLYITIECISATSLKTCFSYLLTHMDVFLMNYLIVLVVTAPCLLFNKMLFVFNILSITLIILTYTNRVMLVIRGLPLRWADFFILKDGLTIANKYVSVPLVVLIILLLGGMTLFLTKTYKIQHELYRPKVIVTFVVIMTLLNTIAITEVGKADVIAESIDEIWIETTEEMAACENPSALEEIKEKIEKLEAMSQKVTLIGRTTANMQKESEDVTKEYEEDGFLYSFLASYESQIAYEPKDYSAESLREIKEKIKAQMKEEPVKEKCIKPNIIFLQVESFIDPYSLKGVSYDKDPVPNMRPYIEGKNGGILKMPDINTARTEFEILTGIRISDLFPAEVPYTSSKLDDRALESAAQLLRGIGYHTTAIHNNNSNFYKRSENYNKLGFEKFIPLEGMKNVTYAQDWPKDEVFLPYIKETINNCVEPSFIFAVTVGTHSSYHYDYISKQKEVNVRSQEQLNDLDMLVPVISKAAVNQVQDYVDRLHDTDKTIGRLIKFVEENKEPTVLVVYGDHIPTMDVITMDDTYPRYEVPYFIVSNQDIPKGIVSKTEIRAAYTLYPSLFEMYHLPKGIIGSAQKCFTDEQDYNEKLNLIGYDLVLGEGYLTNKNTLYKSTKLIVQGIENEE